MLHSKWHRHCYICFSEHTVLHTISINVPQTLSHQCECSTVNDTGGDTAASVSANTDSITYHQYERFNQWTQSVNLSCLSQWTQSVKLSVISNKEEFKWRLKLTWKHWKCANSSSWTETVFSFCQHLCNRSTSFASNLNSSGLSYDGQLFTNEEQNMVGSWYDVYTFAIHDRCIRGITEVAKMVAHCLN